MAFLVQVDEYGIPTTDMGFNTIEACKYQNWYLRGKQNSNMRVVKACNSMGNIIPVVGGHTIPEVTTDFVPVGTMEFVEHYTNQVYPGRSIKPINIPKQLVKQKFLHRKIWTSSVSDIIEKIMSGEYKELFIKSATKCKAYTDIVNFSMLNTIPEDTYLVSSVINIKSEWRVFVFRGDIVDVRLYSGSWEDRFDVEFIKEAVNTYKSCPPAYTLDVGITEGGKMVVVEVHNFISCGLYGFEDYRVIPQMIKAAYRYEMTKKNRSVMGA